MENYETGSSEVLDQQSTNQVKEKRSVSKNLKLEKLEKEENRISLEIENLKKKKIAVEKQIADERAKEVQKVLEQRGMTFDEMMMILNNSK